MRRTLRVVTVTLTAVIVSAAFVAPAAAAAPLQSVRSTHLSGYVRTMAPRFTAVENVNARFTVPEVDCDALPATGGAVSIWVGVDGVTGSSTKNLRAGIQITCRSATSVPLYQAFWAQAPNPARVIGTTSPGHRIYVFVSSEAFQPVNVIDETTDDFFAGGTGAYVSDHTSVECVVDAVGRAGRVVPQPDFKAVRFASCDDFSGTGGGDYRPIADPASALTGETTSRVQNSVGGVRATTSLIKANGSWTVGWVAAT